MTDLLDDTDLDIVTHTVDAIGRTGASSFEFGFLDDDPPHRWWASARYEGAKVTCDNQDSPVGAVLGLYAMLAAGGGCTTCRRTVALDEGGRIVVGARMRRGRFETRAVRGNPDTYCVRRLELDGWTACTRADQ